MNNVINLEEARAKKEKFDATSYQKKVILMDIISLLEEMHAYHDQTDVNFNNSWFIEKGIILFKEISVKARTPELRHMSDNCYRYLVNKLMVMKGK